MNTTLASTTGLVNEAQIKDMPLNGRSFDQLLTLTPGTVNYSSNVNLQGNFFSVVGRRPEETSTRSAASSIWERIRPASRAAPMAPAGSCSV